MQGGISQKTASVKGSKGSQKTVSTMEGKYVAASKKKVGLAIGGAVLADGCVEGGLLLSKGGNQVEKKGVGRRNLKVPLSSRR